MPSDGIWTTKTPARKRQLKHSVEIEITKQIEREWICDLQLYKFTWIWRGFFALILQWLGETNGQTGHHNGYLLFQKYATI